MKYIFLILSICCFCNAAQAVVKGKEVSYEADGVALKGYLAYDDAIKGKRPAVLVVHELWGLNDYARSRARMLAELGYIALAVDMYGNGKVAETPIEASKLAADLNRDIDLEQFRFLAGYDFLLKQENVDTSQIAALGYGFGGSVVLNMARIGVNLKGVASFYGGLDKNFPGKPKNGKPQIISFTGEDDSFITADKVAAFKLEMKYSGANYRVVTYPGAKHAFTNPDADEMGKKFNLPFAYNAAADTDSWEQTKVFLREVFSAK